MLLYPTSPRLVPWDVRATLNRLDCAIRHLWNWWYGVPTEDAVMSIGTYW
jgi:hypothetical protein